MSCPPLAEKPTTPCELCQQPPGGSDDEELVLDHDCATGVVYGVLCRYCSDMLESTEWYRQKREDLMQEAEEALLAEFHKAPVDAREPLPRVLLLGPQQTGQA